MTQPRVSPLQEKILRPQVVGKANPINNVTQLTKYLSDLNLYSFGLLNHLYYLRVFFNEADRSRKNPNSVMVAIQTNLKHIEKDCSEVNQEIRTALAPLNPRYYSKETYFPKRNEPFPTGEPIAQSPSTLQFPTMFRLPSIQLKLNTQMINQLTEYLANIRRQIMTIESDEPMYRAYGGEFSSERLGNDLSNIGLRFRAFGQSIRLFQRDLDLARRIMTPAPRALPAPPVISRKTPPQALGGARRRKTSRKSSQAGKRCQGKTQAGKRCRKLVSCKAKTCYLHRG